MSKPTITVVLVGDNGAGVTFNDTFGIAIDHPEAGAAYVGGMSALTAALYAAGDVAFTKAGLEGKDPKVLMEETQSLSKIIADHFS